MRTPDGELEAHPVDDLVPLSVGTVASRNSDDGRDRMGRYVVQRAGATIPYHAVSSDLMRQWLAPGMPGFDVSRARALLAQYEREPDAVGCAPWVSPRYRERTEPAPPVDCNRGGE